MGDRVDFQYIRRDGTEGATWANQNAFDPADNLKLVQTLRKFEFSRFYTQASPTSNQPAIPGHLIPPVIIIIYMLISVMEQEVFKRLGDLKQNTTMKGIILKLLFIWMGFSFSINEISACSCRYLSSLENLEERIEQSNKIFVGRVIGVEFIRNDNPLPDESKTYIRTKFVMSKSYKGKTMSDTIEVLQEYSNCWYFFEFNKKYLVYTFENKKKDFTDQCTPTVTMSEAKKHFDKLDKIKR